jgi:hypothetical protein
MARVARKQGKFLCGTIRDARIVAAGKKAEVTFTRNPLKMAVEIKNLEGQVLDRKEFRVTP